MENMLSPVCQAAVGYYGGKYIWAVSSLGIWVLISHTEFTQAAKCGTICKHIHLSHMPFQPRFSIEIEMELTDNSRCMYCLAKLLYSVAAVSATTHCTQILLLSLISNSFQLQLVLVVGMSAWCISYYSTAIY